MATHGAAVTPGQTLAALLAAQEMSKRQLAKALARERGISEETAKSSVYKWLRDEHAISETNVLALARILQVEPDVLSSGQSSVVDLLEEFRARLDRAEAEIAALRSEPPAPGRKRESTEDAA